MARRKRHEVAFVLEVDHPLRGPILVGHWHRSKEAARSWRSFVMAAYHGCPTRVRGFTREEAKAIDDNGGQLPKENPDAT